VNTDDLIQSTTGFETSGFGTVLPVFLAIILSLRGQNH